MSVRPSMLPLKLFRIVWDNFTPVLLNIKDRGGDATSSLTDSFHRLSEVSWIRQGKIHLNWLTGTSTITLRSSEHACMDLCVCVCFNDCVIITSYFIDRSTPTAMCQTPRPCCSNTAWIIQANDMLINFKLEQLVNWLMSQSTGSQSTAILIID